MEQLNYSLSGIVTVMVVFHLYGGIYAYKRKFTRAVFERSKDILIFCNFFNIFEIILNLTLGSCINHKKSCSISVEYYLSLISLFTSNCFFMSNFLRLYRLFIITNLESGEFSLENLGWKKKQLTSSWYLTLIVLGAFIFSLPYSTYLIRNRNCSKCLSDLEKYELYCGITISVQSALYLILLVVLYFRKFDLTMKIEFGCHLVCWIAALFVLENPILQRLLYLIPIRNSIMTLITIVSVYEHNTSLRPPLPPEIDLTFTLISQEFFRAFQRYLVNNDFLEHKKLLDLIIKLRIFTENQNHLEALKKNISEAKIISDNMRDSFLYLITKAEFGDFNYEDVFIEIEKYCCSRLIDDPFERFKNSEEFINAHLNY